MDSKDKEKYILSANRKIMKKTYGIKLVEESDFNKFRNLTMKKKMKNKAFTQGDMFAELIHTYTKKQLA